MGLAPGHLLGQQIGAVLEAALKPVLQQMAAEHDLYLDSYGPRPGVRSINKVAWTDTFNNSHDLDFVLERGGTATRKGNPAAFIEAAWRRYGKHSKAKAQEIQGAVLPVIAKWANVGPVAAAVVAGEWTAPALRQLRSSGFVLLHLNFTATVASFAASGIDIRGKDAVEDAFWQRQVDTLAALSDEAKAQLAARVYSDNKSEIDGFVEDLVARVVRTVVRVEVTPMHGTVVDYEDVGSAVQGIRSFASPVASDPFLRFEVRVHYTNGDKIEADFALATDAIRFLESFD